MHECLAYENGRYGSPGRGVSALSGAFPSTSFYLRLFPTIWRTSRRARAGVFHEEELCRACLSVIRFLEASGVRFEVTGAEHFMGLDEPCVFVANHMSTLETFVLPAIALPHQRITFVIKEDLLKTPVFRHIMRSLEPITVSRENPRKDLRAVLEEGTERLRAGTSVVVFPQATRTLEFDPAQFNTMGIKLARRSGAPVIPLAIKSDAWREGKYVKDLGRIDPSEGVCLSFGEPLWVADKGTEVHKRVIQFITGRLNEWGAGGSKPPEK